VIITVTANPSIDRSLRLDAALRRGEVQSVHPGADDAGGKGANVSKALVAARVPTVAVVLADDADPYRELLRATGAPIVAAPAGAAVRVNLTITEPDGTTTKLNAPGLVAPAAMDGLRSSILALLDGSVGERRTDAAPVVVLSGSLPGGADAQWYAHLLPALAQRGARIAVDTSGAPLAAVLDAAVGGIRIAVIKPNGDELSEAMIATGVDPACPSGTELEADPALAVSAVRRLLDARPGIETVLLTLGARGALLVTGDGAWIAAAPPTVVRSTVGAGDSSLAGWIIADRAGADHPARLATAVAYGSAAAALPGSTPPTPAQADPTRVSVTPL
jgi:1-phosphofructokinase